MLLKRNKQVPFIIRSLVFVLAILGMGFSAVMGSAEVLQRAGDDYAARAAQATGEVRRALLAHAVEAYQLAGRLEPWQPLHAFKMGYAYEIGASTLAPLSIDSQAAWTAAAASYGQAVLRHPANGRIQAALAWAALQSGNLISSRRAVQAALKLAPDYPDVRFTVARWYLTQWEALSGEDQQLTIALVQRGAQEFPELYVDATWQFIRDSKTVRRILPENLKVRRLLLNRLTERGLFADRWAELAAHPELRISAPADGVHVIISGNLTGRQEPPYGATTAGPWSGMVEGWLSGGLTAQLDLELSPGETVLYLPVLGEPAGGIWPALNVTLGGHGLALPEIKGPGWRTAYVLVSTPGGRLPLHVLVSNGAVVNENGRFVERRIRLGHIQILIPSAKLAG